MTIWVCWEYRAVILSTTLWTKPSEYWSIIEREVVYEIIGLFYVY